MPLNRMEFSTRQAVMVTGAAGFIGSRIVRRLLIDGFPVVGIVRAADGHRLSRLRSVLGRGACMPLHLVACDLLDDGAVAAMIAVNRPVACIHAAWEIDPKGYRDDPRNDRWVSAGVHLLRELRTNGCQWLGVFGTCIEPVLDAPAECRYAAAKAMLRQQLMQARGKSSSQRDAVRVCWWKLFQPYGPGEPTTRLVPSLIDALLNGRQFTINAPADVRDFIHVDDIAGATVASMVHRCSGAFDLGTGEGTSLAALARLAGDLLNTPHLIRLGELTPQQTHTAVSRIARDRGLLSAAQWKADIDVRRGLAHLIAHACRKARAA